MNILDRMDPYARANRRADLSVAAPLGIASVGGAILALLLIVHAAPGTAQTLSREGLGDNAILVEADEGIEWRPDEQVFEAIGNVTAVRGDLTVYGNVLRAFYRETEESDTDIHRLEAIGNVIIVSPAMEARGDRAVYDFDTGTIVVTGRNVQFETDEYQVFANGNLEYHEFENFAVANGGAKAVTGDREIRADRLYAYFANANGAAGESNNLEVERLFAEGNMVIVTPCEVVQATTGTYFPNTEIAIAEGDVQITRGDSHIVGEVARVNMITGVSQITASRPGEGPRVIGLFTPGSLNDDNEAACATEN